MRSTAAVTVSDAPTASPSTTRGPVRGFLDMIAFEHSVFALPFALLAVWAASDGAPAARDVAWVVVAMVAARTAAMAANRIADRAIDAANPRTAQRELVTGAVSLRVATAGLALSVGVFAVAVSQLDRVVWPLAPVALVLLVGYPYVKRWSWTAHFALGLTQAVAPVGAWLAVTGRWSWSAVALGLAVGCWVAGFDLIYATQDVDADRALGVHSLPEDFSVGAALTASRLLHVATVALLVTFGVADGRGWLWWAAVAGGAAMLVYEG